MKNHFLGSYHNFSYKKWKVFEKFDLAVKFGFCLSVKQPEGSEYISFCLLLGTLVKMEIQRRSSSGLSSFLCAVCQKTFVCIESLETHVKVHKLEINESYLS